MDNRKFGAFTSSVDPEKFSQTWESILKMLGTVASVFAAIPMVNTIVPPSDVQTIIDAVTLIGGAIATIYHSGNLVFGIARKIIAKIYG